MAAVKLHSFRGSNDGSVSCDFRGSNFIGHEQGDEHHTVLEVDPAPDALVAEVLEFGPRVNALLSKIRSAEPGGLELAFDSFGEGTGPVGLRIGVWDQ